MNPNAEQQPSMPMPEQSPVVANEQLASAETNLPARPEQAPLPAAAPPIAAIPMPDPGQTSVPVDPTAASGVGSTPQAADDNDLIEKEWVVKAKQIVAATKNDPYQQNRQLAAIKADYMQKRYNKVVKLSE